ncbi:MAG TPA: hypothetical protein PK397_06920 [Ignavibacteriaceae bacterium]|jgi:hypothetical protein|nr:hypothetical protein [Ignavibacteriaceae bacterium]
MKYIMPVVFLFSTFSLAQEINWKNLSVGGTIQYVIPEGDFGEYWEPAFAFGICGKLKLNPFFSLVGEATYSYFPIKKSADTIQAPNISFLNLSSGIQFSIRLSSTIQSNFGFGIDNNTFTFVGESAEDLGDNNTESEFGTYIQTGVLLEFKNLPSFELNVKLERIFTSPERITVIKFGFSTYFF